MRGRYLEVTYRGGRILAAYLYFPRFSGARRVRTVPASSGILGDLCSDDTVIGLEITSPVAITLNSINAVLTQLGQPCVSASEIAPLLTA
jgi:hypothetical protein